MINSDITNNQSYYNILVTHKLLLIISIVYKLLLDCAFWTILKQQYYFSKIYCFDFNSLKYLIGCIWLAVLFILIDHDSKKPSTFFLQLQYFLAIIPISTIYAFSNKNTLYYIAVCISFAAAEILVRVINDKKLNKNRIFIFFEKPIFTKLLIFSLYLITVVVYIDIIIKNGLFSFKALNIYAVYTIRDDFSLHLVFI